jgi:hypothetical protein
VIAVTAVTKVLNGGRTAMVRRLDDAPSDVAHAVGLEGIGEDNPDEEDFLRSIWEEGDDRGSFWRRSGTGWR